MHLGMFAQLSSAFISIQDDLYKPIRPQASFRMHALIFRLAFRTETKRFTFYMTWLHHDDYLKHATTSIGCSDVVDNVMFMIY